MIAANLHDLAVHEHDAEPKHIVCGHAIFQAMGAACVHRDIAAERASELARRIRGIKEAFCRDGIGDGDIGDAGLDAGRAVRHVDGEHFGHARDAEHDRVFER